MIEGLARASYLELDFAQAIEGWERAYAAHRADQDRIGAVRVARTLAYMYGSIVGDGAVMGGWLARAQSLLDGDTASPEAGWVSLNIGMWESDRVRREARFRGALEVARRAGDSDLEFVALAYLGATLVHDDRTEQGVVLLDEALAAVSGSEVDDFCALQEIFCQLFAACEHAHDVSRADQWIRVGEAIAARRQLPAVSAFCRTHYGGLLTNAGRWPEADAALTEAVRLWGLGHRSLRGGALARLADLRARQGRYEEAEHLLDGLEGDLEAARPRAVTQLARGDTSLACDTLERALGEVDPLGTAVAPLLALLVDVHLEAGKLDEADAAVRALEACAARHGSHYLAASAALARGRLCLAVGTGDPQSCLREALAQFDRAQMPFDVAHVRLELANALLTERPEVALAEARVALAAFARLGAQRHVDAAAAVLRQLGVRSTSGGKGAGSLTKREAEVLELLSHGRSNREISDRLFISRKTVEHHVGNVLAKLGLRSRSEAPPPTPPGSKAPRNRQSPRCARTGAGAACGDPRDRRILAMATDYDAIIVGARCAGAPTAMLLARKGHRVLVVDRASFPSDTMSTHMIHAPGIAALHRWELLDEVTATGCPPVESYSFDFGPFTITGRPRPRAGIATGYSPRRTVLDKILVDAADHAGAEVRERFTVEDVVVEDGTVVGIRGHGEGGHTVVERAGVVIGADGRNSHVAKAVHPAQYNDKPMLQWSYYTYWSGLPVDGFEVVVRPDRGWAAMPTNDGLTLVVVGWLYAEAAAYKADVGANYLKTLKLAPEFAERVRSATREARFVGTAVPNFFRTPYGPGWALVGDAAYNKDPITAQGISDAFRDAELCATALDDTFAGRRPFEAAMATYQQTRDDEVLPIYEFTTQLATLAAPPAEMQQLLGAVHGNQDAMDDFARSPQAPFRRPSSSIPRTSTASWVRAPRWAGDLLSGLRSTDRARLAAERRS